MDTKTIIIQFNLMEKDRGINSNFYPNKLQEFEFIIKTVLSKTLNGDVTRNQVGDKTFEIFINKVNDVNSAYDLILSILENCSYDFKIAWVPDKVMDSLDADIDYPQLKSKLRCSNSNRLLFNFWTT